MSENTKAPYEASPEQEFYATILFFGSWIGIFLMITTYFIYIFKILPPHIPIQDVINNWHLPADEFVKKLKLPEGWGWVSFLGNGDYFNFLGIALMGALTIICFFSLVFAYFAKKDKIYFTVACVEILVLILAASGILGTGGH